MDFQIPEHYTAKSQGSQNLGGRSIWIPLSVDLETKRNFSAGIVPGDEKG